MFTIDQLRSLKGAPFSVLYVLSQSPQPVTQEYCARLTGYSVKTVYLALLTLKEMGLAIRNSRYAWQAADSSIQFPFATPEDEEPRTRKNYQSDLTTATTTIVDKPPHKGKSAAEEEKDRRKLRVNLNALKSAGIMGRKAQTLAALPHINPGYIRAHQAYAERRGDSTGLLITRLEDGDPKPKPPEEEDRKYITGKYAAFIQH